MSASEVPLLTPLWPFKANWRESPTTEYVFNTTIFVSTSGKEQRRALRVQPRFSMSFLMSALDGRTQQQLDRFIGESQNKGIVVPDYTRVRRAEVTSTTKVTPLAIARWPAVGALIVLRDDETTEVRRILSFAGGVITLETPVTMTGAIRIYPAMYGRLDESLSVNMVTASVKEPKINFQALPGFQIPVYAGEPGVMFDGREVFLHKANWQARSHTYTSERTDLDYGGRIASYNPIKFGSRVYRSNFLAKSREELEALAGFFFRRFGRLKEFFAPSYTDDLTLVSTTANSLTVVSNGATDLADNPVDRAIAIFMDDEQVSFHRVTAMVAGETTQVLSIEPNLPWSVAPGAVSKVCWMPLCRFATDNLSVVHRTAEVATLDLTIQTLEYRPVDAPAV